MFFLIKQFLFSIVIFYLPSYTITRRKNRTKKILRREDESETFL